MYYLVISKLKSSRDLVFLVFRCFSYSFGPHIRFFFLLIEINSYDWKIRWKRNKALTLKYESKIKR